MNRILSLGVVLFVACGGGEKKSVQQGQEDANIARSILMVIAHEDFSDDEFKRSFDLFTRSGITVAVASTDTTTATGMAGMTVVPDITLEAVNSKDYDGLVVVGGDGCKILWDNETLHQVVRDFNATNKTIAAMCLAPIILANAGILEGRIVTASPTVRDEIGKACARCTDSDIEVSGNIVTCSAPLAAAALADTVLILLNE
ncbi:MAG: DJ-1/PfpI family protein [candidate division WOR-3 bacterium]|jgi:protease I